MTLRPGFARTRILQVTLLLAAAAGAQVADKPDTAEAPDRGFPWIAHSSVDAFVLKSQAAGGGSPYQISAYQGVTIQSLRFAWFHVGLRSRETMAPGFTAPYREPLVLKLMGTAEILRDYAYAFMAGNLPLRADHVNIADTGALYRAESDYDAFPYPNFLSPRALQAGGFARYRFPAWEAMGGLGYARASSFDPVGGALYSPASYYDVFARALIENESARHRFDVKTTFYGQESDAVDVPAHQEGSLWQIRYGYLRFGGGKAWQLGAGAAWKTRDANRLLRIPAPLAPTALDDNIQRAYGEFALAWAPRSTLLLRAHLLPKLLFLADGSQFGEETEGGMTLALRMWKVHRLRVTGTALYGSFRHEDYLGFGCNVEFTFRHLGFQDLEAVGDAETTGGDAGN